MLQDYEPNGLDLKTREWASEYAEKDSRLVLLPWNPESYDGQQGHVVVGDPKARGIVDAIATIAFMPNPYEVLHEQLEEQENSQHVDTVTELLLGGNSVVLTTDHGDLIDIAIAQAIIYSQILKRLDKLGLDAEFDTAIILNKIIAHLGIEIGGSVVPCVQALQDLDNAIYLSYPQSESAEAKGISKGKKSRLEIIKDKIATHKATDEEKREHEISETISKHNPKVRADVIRTLGEDAVLLAVALGGSTIKSLNPDKPSEKTLATVGGGTLGMIIQKNTYLLKVALHYNGSDAYIKVCGAPRAIINDEVVHSGMEELAVVLSEHDKEATYTYKRPLETNE